MDTLVGRTADKGWEEKGWHFTWEELNRNASWKDNISADEQRVLRRKTHQFMFVAGRELKASPIAVAAAMMIWHRLFAQISFKGVDRLVAATAALFLASKVEEARLKLKDVLVECFKQRFRKKGSQGPQLAMNSKEYHEFRERVLAMEETLIISMGFDFSVEQPYAHIKPTANRLAAQGWLGPDACKIAAYQGIQLANTSLKGTMCLEYQPTYLARLMVYISIICMEIDAPESEGTWARAVQLDEDPTKLNRGCCDLMELLDKTKTPLTRKEVAVALEREGHIRVNNTVLPPPPPLTSLAGSGDTTTPKRKAPLGLMAPMPDSDSDDEQRQWPRPGGRSWPSSSSSSQDKMGRGGPRARSGSGSLSPPSSRHPSVALSSPHERPTGFRNVTPTSSSSNSRFLGYVHDDCVAGFIGPVNPVLPPPPKERPGGWEKKSLLPVFDGVERGASAVRTAEKLTAAVPPHPEASKVEGNTMGSGTSVGHGGQAANTHPPHPRPPPPRIRGPPGSSGSGHRHGGPRPPGHGSGHTIGRGTGMGQGQAQGNPRPPPSKPCLLGSGSSHTAGGMGGGAGMGVGPANPRPPPPKPSSVRHGHGNGAGDSGQSCARPPPPKPQHRRPPVGGSNAGPGLRIAHPPPPKPRPLGAAGLADGGGRWLSTEKDQGKPHPPPSRPRPPPPRPPTAKCSRPAPGATGASARASNPSPSGVSKPRPPPPRPRGGTGSTSDRGEGGGNGARVDRGVPPRSPPPKGPGVSVTGKAMKLRLQTPNGPSRPGLGGSSSSDKDSAGNNDQTRAPPPRPCPRPRPPAGSPPPHLSQDGRAVGNGDSGSMGRARARVTAGAGSGQWNEEATSSSRSSSMSRSLKRGVDDSFADGTCGNGGVGGEHQSSAKRACNNTGSVLVSSASSSLPPLPLPSRGKPAPPPPPATRISGGGAVGAAAGSMPPGCGSSGSSIGGTSSKGRSSQSCEVGRSRTREDRDGGCADDCEDWGGGQGHGVSDAAPTKRLRLARAEADEEPEDGEIVL